MKNASDNMIQELGRHIVTRTKTSIDLHQEGNLWRERETKKTHLGYEKASRSISSH